MASSRSSGAPFPRVPEPLCREFGIGELWLRAYGIEAADLDIDFRAPDRLGLEIDVLGRCARTGDDRRIAPDFFRRIEVGKRVEALLVVTALSGSPPVEVRLSCARPGCREPMEVELSVSELRELQRASE